jgi:azurin
MCRPFGHVGRSMKTIFARSLLFIAGLLAASLVPATASAAAPAPRTVTITAGDMMKYDVMAITAAPGEELKVVLVNGGTQPKKIMGHNWILLKAGSDAGAFAAAAQPFEANEYFPDALKDQVLARIKLLGPKETGEVTFKAPTKPGDYPFLCTFPAHFLIGMKGVLTVK